MSEIVVRRAEPDDFAGLAWTFTGRSAAGGTLQNPYPSAAEWKERLADPKQAYVLVALVDGKIVGHAGLHRMQLSARRAHCWGIGMAVHDDWQGRGVGTRLLEAIVDLADNWIGALRLELTVYTDNDRAVRLYERFGFAHEGTHRAFALREGAYVDAYAMARFHPNPPQLPRA